MLKLCLCQVKCDLCFEIFIYFVHKHLEEDLGFFNEGDREELLSFLLVFLFYGKGKKKINLSYITFLFLSCRFSFKQVKSWCFIFAFSFFYGCFRHHMSSFPRINPRNTPAAILQVTGMSLCPMGCCIKSCTLVSFSSKTQNTLHQQVYLFP